jgi:hypothetical protein
MSRRRQSVRDAATVLRGHRACRPPEAIRAAIRAVLNQQGFPAQPDGAPRRAS